MDNLLTGLDLSKPPVLQEILCWMDGGSVTLNLRDCKSRAFSVEICQTMSLQKHPLTSVPGSLLLNGQEVAIRSTTETVLLAALKQLNLNQRSALDQQIIQERIAFVESEEYLRIAALMGRI